MQSELRHPTTAALAAALLGVLALGACSDDPDSDDSPDMGGSGQGASNDEGSAPDASNDETEDAATLDAGDPMGPRSGRPASSSLMLPTTMEYPGEEPWFNVYRPEDLDAAGGPLPVIAWANGGCYRSDFTWEPLFNRWAAGGFIVLALTTHPETGSMVQTNVDDQGALIDWALAQADADGSPYRGKIDPDRIVAAGNSCGGITALGLTARDPRVAAVFVLSGSSGFGAANTAVIDNISVPVGYIVGGAADIAGANASSDYDALAEGIPAMIVSRFEGDHRTVSTDPNILAEEARISLDWMDLALYGSQEAYDMLTSETVCSDCAAGHYSLTSKNLEALVH